MRYFSITLLLTFCISLQLNAQSTYLSQIGKVGQLPSEVLGTTKNYYVQLLYGYDPERPNPYPVVYLMDGESLLPTLYAVSEPYSGGFLPEMILIGIDNSENRTRDLTISSVETLFGQPAKDRTGKASTFLEFIKSELIPHIESEFNAADYRTLIGHSYGGLFTMYTLLNSPETFANYLAIDPTMKWDNQLLLKDYKDAFSQRDFKGKSLFMSLNGQLNPQDPSVTLETVMEDDSFVTEFARASIAFSNMVKANASNGLDFEWKFYPRDLHGTIPLPSMMDGLISMFEWFQMENVHKFNDPETPIEELAEIIQYRAEKLERYLGHVVPPYPADLINAQGYMSMDVGQFDKAMMFMKHQLEFFPSSANSYDSMADYYERQKQPAEALKYAEKALAISGSDYLKEKVARLKKEK